MDEHQPHILCLDPVLVPKPWGGRRLAAFGKTLPDDGPYGESWDVADLPADVVTTGARSRSVVATGPLAGAALRDVIAAWGADLMGSAAATPAGDFPLLFKLLDAHEHLSVQVHPDAAYAATDPSVAVKTESWYVVDAQPGAVIYKDVLPGVAIDDVAAAAGTQAMVELLQPIPAEPGAFHHLPAGLLHALGAGVLVAEPQTPSDTTFRLYDWTEEYGRAPRPLHVEQAVAALRIEPDGAFSLDPADQAGSRLLIAHEHYWMLEHSLASGSGPLGDDRELRIVTVLDGEAELSHRNTVTRLAIGDTVVVPAAIVPNVAVATTMATWLEIGIAGAV
jgi:mannose-6-phosphate isomerase